MIDNFLRVEYLPSFDLLAKIAQSINSESSRESRVSVARIGSTSSETSPNSFDATAILNETTKGRESATKSRETIIERKESLRSCCDSDHERVL